MEEVEHLLNELVKSLSSSLALDERVIDIMIQEVEDCVKEVKKLQKLASSSIADEKSKQPVSSKKRKAVENLCKSFAESTPLKIVQDSHKRVQLDLTKFGKAIDDNFSCDTSWIQDATPPNADDIHKAIVRHLTRKGQFEIAEKILEERNKIINGSDESKTTQGEAPEKEEIDQADHFKIMYKVLNALEKHDVAPMCTWLEQHKPDMKNVIRTNDLEFQIHCAKFILLSKNGEFSKAVEYARKEMASFKETKKREIQQLLGGLVLLGSNKEKMENSIQDIFSTLRELFLVKFCKFHAIEKDSHVDVCLRAGESILPRLVKYFNFLVHAEQQGMNSEGFKGMILSSRMMNFVLFFGT
mmetsp:Transcript_16844/g.19107  ORF Transcript_16844/g.19107 Transcript_16844/m.19107 type:complete len:356 (-) Transcript_16844:1101-2168(-)|eukprot:CAMPEP_0184031690 /NCGR_PEP_ID=MMETSP0955-20130417/2434_1 /TAXON_ID=627963 /ORGANISM="Aplanochytrium sp, Strain PBS07" /LENGTH=355 /DNA_ID=CAMNT_0026317515 /DNA_START=139 /DNA_END=1206 /DNA_ORIENTATION=-